MEYAGSVSPSNVIVTVVKPGPGGLPSLYGFMMRQEKQLQE